MQRPVHPALSVRPGFLKALLLAACAAAAGYHLGRSALRWALHAPVRCDQPCTADKPDCAPISVDFSLKETRVRAGEVPRMWSRVVVTNRTCGEVSLHLDFFYDGHAYGHHRRAGIPLSMGSLIYQILDSEGRVQEPVDAYWTGVRWVALGQMRARPSPSVLVVSDPQGRDDTFERAIQYFKPGEREEVPIRYIRPYFVDSQAQKRLQDKSDRGIIRLAPGESVATVQTVYWPHQRRTIEVEVPGIGPGSASGAFPVEVRERIAPDPPEGYQLFNNFVFTRPGRYRIRVVHDGVVIQNGEYLQSRWPLPIVRLLWVLADVFEVEGPRLRRTGPIIVSNDQEVWVE